MFVVCTAWGNALKYPAAVENDMNNRISDKTSKPATANSLAEEPREFVQNSKARFAPADNLYDAIRFDIGPNGIDDFEPLPRQYDREPPFSEIDEDWFDDETRKPE
jgi:hypothetical protein